MCRNQKRFEKGKKDKKRKKDMKLVISQQHDIVELFLLNIPRSCTFTETQMPPIAGYVISVVFSLTEAGLYSLEISLYCPYTSNAPNCKPCFFCN